MKIAACALASAILLCGAGAANAELATMVVNIRGVDSGSVSGAAIVLRRINGAAKSFCGGDNSKELSYLGEQLRCRRHMAYMAVNKLDKPMVTALYEQTAQPPLLLAQRPTQLASR